MTNKKAELIKKMLGSLNDDELVELMGDTLPIAVPKKAKASKVKKKAVVKKKSPPKSKPKPQDDDSIPDYTDLTGDDEDEDDVIEDTETSIRQKRPSKKSASDRACRVEPINLRKKRTNSFDNFLANMSNMPLTSEEREMIREAKASDAKLRKKKIPKPAKRPKSLCKVRCSVCGTKEIVSASLVHNPKTYRCNNCYSGS